jgi:hypothetical protein
MRRAGWSFLSLMTSLALCAISAPAAAKKTGMNLPCHNCHEGQSKPQVAVMTSATRVEPGQPVTFTITAKHERAKIGGVLIDSHGEGKLEVIDAMGTRLFDDTVTQAVHAMPHPYANGQVQFSFRWIAPAAPAAVVFDIWSNAANANDKPEDDAAGEAVVGVAVGCDAAWYYLDADLDGTGAENSKVFSCTPVADRITVGGDCNDLDAKISPKVAELCNSIDDDCDGKADNGFTPVLLVTDADGDGYGTSQGMSMIGCPPVPGFATTFDDCNDTDAAVNPGAMELANGRDDNCNGKVDDAGAMPGTGGTGGTASGTGGTTTAPLGATPTEAGCALSAPARLTPLHGFGATFLLGAVAWRRIARRLRKNTLSA